MFVHIPAHQFPHLDTNCRAALFRAVLSLSGFFVAPEKSEQAKTDGEEWGRDRPSLVNPRHCDSDRQLIRSALRCHIRGQL